MAQGIRDSEIPGEAWRGLERLGESLEAKRDLCFVKNRLKLDQKSTLETPKSTPEAPKSPLEGSKIDPGGSTINPGGPGGSQARPKSIFL